MASGSLPIGAPMDCIGIMFIALIVLAGCYALGHRDGKHLGSRKAYGVGFQHGRRGRDAGCLILLLALGLSALSLSALCARVYTGNP